MHDETARIGVESGLVVRPGDTLLVRVDGPMDIETADEMKAELKARLPGVGVVLVVAGQLAVYRPDGGDGDA